MQFFFIQLLVPLVCILFDFPINFYILQSYKSTNDKKNYYVCYYRSRKCSVLDRFLLTKLYQQYYTVEPKLGITLICKVLSFRCYNAFKLPTFLKGKCHCLLKVLSSYFACLFSVFSKRTMNWFITKLPFQQHFMFVNHSS